MQRKYWEQSLRLLLSLIGFGFSLVAALPAPTAYWDFEEGQGTQLLDKSGNGHNGTITGSPAWVTGGPKGSSLYLNGSTHVQIPASTSFSSMHSFTLSAWVWQDTENLDRPIMEFSPSAALSGVQLWANTTGGGVVVPGNTNCTLRDLTQGGGYNAGASYQFYTSGGVLPASQWNHLVLTYDSLSHTGKIYANKILQASSTTSSNYHPSTDGSFNLGWRPTTSSESEAGRHFLGRLDEVRIYSTALTATQIDSLYSLSFTPSPPSALSYSRNPAVYGVGVAISSNTPTVTGTAPITFSVSPALPAGLTLNTSTGVITGTPTAAAPAAYYTVTATNSYGIASASLNITVIAAPSGLSYSANPAQYVVGTNITPNSPTVTGAITGYSASPTLPAGLTMNTTTGVITGSPTTPATATNYTITATNAQGSSTTATLNITVRLKPSNLVYTVNPALYFVGTAITPNSASVQGTAPITFSTSPALPAGLTLNTGTGVISGTPTAVSAAANYVITASNPAGSTTATLAMAVSTPISILDQGNSRMLTLRISGSASIMIPLPKETTQGVRLELLNMKGARMWDGRTDVGNGSGTIAWDGMSNGGPVPTGIYFARISSIDGLQNRFKTITQKFVYSP